MSIPWRERVGQWLRSGAYFTAALTGIYMWVLVAIPIGKATYAWLLPYIGYLAFPAAGAAVFSIAYLATAGAPFYALWIGFTYHNWTPSMVLLAGVVLSLVLLGLSDQVDRGRRS